MSSVPTLDTIRALARRAGAAAMAHYGTAESTVKTGGSPVTAADHAANAVIVEELARSFPRDAILSEELNDSPVRLKASRVWIIDPLDGTKEFLAQNGEFAIMIGLAVDGFAVLGVVYVPDGDRMYSAAEGQGAWVEQGSERRRLTCGTPDPADLRMVGSRSHGEALVYELKNRLGVTRVRPCGSVGVKCSLIALGECDLYVHPVPYLKEWDTCAPEVIIREAGGDVVDCHGEPLRYNKPNPGQPHGIVVTAPGIRDIVMQHLAPLYLKSTNKKA